MIKAKDFLDNICNNFDYRFFSGYPSMGTHLLYKYMNKSILYYVPAITAEIATGLCVGASYMGTNSCVLIDYNGFNSIVDNLYKFKDLNSNILFIIDNTNNLCKLPTTIDYEFNILDDNWILKNYNEYKINLILINEDLFR